MSKKETAAVETGASKEVEAIADVVQKGLTYDKAGKKFTPADKLFESTLPEGLTIDSVMAGYDAVTNFVAGSKLGFGLASIEAMKSDKKLDTTTVEISLGGKNFVTHSAKRSATYPGISKPGEEPKPPVTKYSPISTTVTMEAGRNVGDMKKVTVALAAMAQNALA